jgi:hypothetical protein
MKRTLYPLIAALVLLTQCKPEEEKVSKQEVEKFVTEMENGALKRRPNLFTSNLIFEALTERMQQVKDIKNMSAIKEGMKKSLKNSELDREIYATISNGGSFEKVKTYEKNGMQRAIFRVFGDDGMNYLDMELTKLEGKVGIADMFIYTTGENFSKTLSELLSRMTEGVSDKKAMEMADDVQGVKRLMAKGNYEQAKKEFDRLPMFFKNTRVADIINLQICSNLDSEIYLKEMEQFNTKYAGDPSLELAMIDLHFLRKDYDKALRSVDVLDSTINKDPFLDYYRGIISKLKGDNDKAMAYYKNVTISNPAFSGAFEQLVFYYTGENDQATSKQYFDKYKNLRNADPEFISSYEMMYPYLKK